MMFSQMSNSNKISQPTMRNRCGSHFIINKLGLLAYLAKYRTKYGQIKMVTKIKAPSYEEKNHCVMGQVMHAIIN